MADKQLSQHASDKESLEYVEDSFAREPASERSEPEFDKAFERKTMRQVDLRLLPILGALYAVSLIDRTNLSNARIAGMEKDLQLFVGERYSAAALIFFVPYFLFELPANMVIRKVGPRNLLAFIVLAWGAVMIGMGFVKDWRMLVVCRTLLGLFEAGFFPGCAFLITCWFTRYEVQVRLAFFYLMSVGVSGFAAIIAWALSLMEGTSGIRGWRWIFIIEGVATCALGILAWFLIIDFPDRNTYLTSEQKKLVLRRIEEDRGDQVHDPLTLAKTGRYLCDLKLWASALMFMGSTMPAYAFSYFLPIILRGFGYSVRDSQLLSAPPYVTTVIVCLVLARLADKYSVRSLFIILQATISIVGLAITAYHKNNGVRYFGTFLGIAGCQGNIPAVLAWNANNIRGQSKRAVSSALVVGFGAIGGIFASTVYRQQDAPAYLPGLWATIACQLMIIAIAGASAIYFAIQNKRADQGKRAEIEGSPTFRYTL